MVERETTDFHTNYIRDKMHSSTTESKRDRATHEQLEVYVAFCRARPEMISRKNWPNKPQQMRKLWQQLTEELNCCRGPTRNVAKWKETLCVWKSHLHARARRLKINQRLTDGAPSLKPMTDFEKKALNTFASAAVMSTQSFYLKTHDPLTVECPTSPTGTASSSGSPRPLSSPLLVPSNNGQPESPLNSEPPATSPCPSVGLENQDASTLRLSRSERNELINTLIVDIAKRNGAEERQRIENERRQEHWEMVQAIQGLTNTVMELVNVLKQNLSNRSE